MRYRKSIKKNLASRTDRVKLRRREDKSVNYEDSPAVTKGFWKGAKIFTPQKRENTSWQYYV